MQPKPLHAGTFWIILLMASILLGIATTYAQVEDVSPRFLRNQQMKVHDQMMDGTAGNPWQYRILADWMIDAVLRLFVERNIPDPKASTYILFRFLQCVLIFMMAGGYYRKLGLRLFANLLGLSVLAWGMSHSLYNSDFSFNIFFDIAFYLTAALLIMDRAFGWIPLLMIPAAFNRETSALIPFLLLSFAYFDEQKKDLKPALLFTALSLVIFGAIFAGLRIYYGEQPFLTADGYYPGIGLLVLNLSRAVTWEQILITFGLIPFLAIFSYHAWPRALKLFFWVVVPVWFGVHFLSSLVAESRLLLVPLALVFIPGALLGITSSSQSAQNP